MVKILIKIGPKICAQLLNYYIHSSFFFCNFTGRKQKLEVLHNFIIFINSYIPENNHFSPRQSPSSMAYHVLNRNLNIETELETIQSEGSIGSASSSFNSRYSDNFSPQPLPPVNYQTQQNVANAPSYNSLPADGTDMMKRQGLNKLMNPGSFIGAASSSSSDPLLNETTGNSTPDTVFALQNQ